MKRPNGSIAMLVIVWSGTASSAVTPPVGTEATLETVSGTGPPDGKFATSGAGNATMVYRLASLDILRWTVVTIQDKYFDSKRIHPKEMFLAAVKAVARNTAEVMVVGNAQEGRVKVSCGKAVREFKFDDVDSLWMIPLRIQPVFAFLQDNLAPTANERNVEYAAVNGMLSTLDHRSRLIEPDEYRVMTNSLRTQSTSKIFPGFSRFSGSSARFSARSNANSSGERE